MDVDISRIAKLYGAFLDVHLSEEIETFENNYQKIKFTTPANVTGTITNLGEIFIFEGTAEIGYSTFCDKCLRDFDNNLKVNISEKFAFQKNDKFEDDVNVFQGDTIELMSTVINNIILSLPMSFICSEECKGLCPQCGINRNIEKCNCSEGEADPRLEKLKSLFKID